MARKILSASIAAGAIVAACSFLMVGTASAGNRLMAGFTPGKCLDIINDGQNNKLVMAKCGKYSGQDWTATRIGSTDGFKLRNNFSGANKCLDVVNDGRNDKLIMAACGNYSGQSWSIPKAGKVGAFQNDFTGAGKCLDIINDGQNNKLILAKCGNFSGQHWNAAPF